MSSIVHIQPTGDTCLFKKLALELRTMTYELLTSARHIMILHQESTDEIYSTAHVPAELQLCHESRILGLK
jgi:hypothetical protein